MGDGGEKRPLAFSLMLPYPLGGKKKGTISSLFQHVKRKKGNLREKKRGGKTQSGLPIYFGFVQKRKGRFA